MHEAAAAEQAARSTPVAPGERFAT